MTPFLAIAALLVLVVLGILLVPLLARARKGSTESSAAGNAAIYAEQLADLDSELSAGKITREQWAATRTEIERRALEEEAQAEPARPGRSIAAAATVAIAIPALAVGLYLWIGNPQALLPPEAKAPDAGHSITPEQIQAMIARLTARLESKPDDAEGWYVLARTYGTLGRYQESANAYAKAAKLLPNDAQLLADYADTLAVASGRKLEGEPAALVERALKADGNNVKALALAGTIAFERGDYKGALAHWQKAVQILPPGSGFAESIKGSIADAEKRLGVSSPAPARAAAPASAPATATAPPPAVASAPAAKTSAAKGASIQGRISLAPAAAAAAKPDDSVFIFARATEGPRSPIVVQRIKVKDLPFDFSLDDSMAMDPAKTLSGFSQVVLVARVSRSGNAVAQKGDFEAATKPIAPGSKGIKLEIAKAIE